MRPLVVLVEFLVKASFRERFRELVAVNAKASLERERGCRRFDVLIEPDEPRKFVLFEIYDDAAAFDEHLRSSHYKSFARAIANEIEHRSIHRLTFSDEMGASVQAGGKTPTAEIST